MKPLVKNAADPAQVKNAENRLLNGRDLEIRDLQEILQTVAGRRFLWRLLGHTKVFGTVWEASARIHYNAGMQDVGHFIMSEILEASPDGYLLMQKEAQMREERK